jgi:hypothetical protein
MSSATSSASAPATTSTSPRPPPTAPPSPDHGRAGPPQSRMIARRAPPRPQPSELARALTEPSGMVVGRGLEVRRPTPGDARGSAAGCPRSGQVTPPAERSRTGGLSEPAGRTICCGAAWPSLWAASRGGGRLGARRPAPGRFRSPGHLSQTFSLPDRLGRAFGPGSFFVSTPAALPGAPEPSPSCRATLVPSKKTNCPILLINATVAPPTRWQKSQSASGARRRHAARPSRPAAWFPPCPCNRRG